MCKYIAIRNDPAAFVILYVFYQQGFLLFVVFKTATNMKWSRSDYAANITSISFYNKKKIAFLKRRTSVVE